MRRAIYYKVGAEQMRILKNLTFLLLIAGCHQARVQTPKPTQQQMLDRLIGYPIDVVLKQVGPPAQILDDGGIKIYVFRWQQISTSTESNPGTVYNSGTKSRPNYVQIIPPTSQTQVNVRGQWMMLWVDSGKITKTAYGRN